MNKAKSFLIFILLFGLLLGFPLSKTSAASNYLTLTSSPAGATVYINKVKQTSLTPCAFNKKVPGTPYVITFNKVGYAPQTIKITASVANSKLAVVLKKVLAFKVTSSPAGATVYINNVKQVSLTPCLITGYASGTVLNFKLIKPGYLPFSQVFSTKTEGTSNISVKLLAIPSLPVSPVPALLVVEPPSAVVPAIQYASTTATENKAFAWTYAGTAYTWNVQAPSSLLTFARSQTAFVTTIYNSNSYSEQQSMLSTASPLLKTMVQEGYEASYGDYIAWTQEPQNTTYMQQLATALDTAAKTAGYDYFHEAEFILNFVGASVPYKVTPWYQLPTLTLFESGKCVDKSILYASILKALGYKVALFGLPNVNAAMDGHEAVGVDFTPQQMTQTGYSFTPYPQAGNNYYFAETTLQGWLLGQKSFSQIPLIYPLN